MKRIKFETVKTKAVKALKAREYFGLYVEMTGLLAIAAIIEALERQPGAPSLKGRANKTFSEWVDYAERMINAWDVRQVRGLFRAFPETFPKKWAGSTITCEMEDTESADWVVHIN